MIRLLLAALTFATAPAWAKPPAPKDPGPGVLVLGATTEGAEVWIDGEKRGLTPLPEPLLLPPGEHTIKVQKLGYAPLIDVFKIGKRGQTRLDVELVPVSGVVRVRANVEQARVAVDGKFACEAPCAAEVDVGPHTVVVSRGGYKDATRSITSVAGQEVAVELALEELPLGLNPYKPPPPPPPKWFEKWWVWTVAAVGAGAIAVAVAVPVTQAQKDPVREFGPSYTWTITLGK